jgi:tetratricopeptide (TPR) repeat protein
VLFDLRSGKRRRVVQVMFGGLAAIFLISFVGFGIGSPGTGGLFDALGLTNSSGGSGSPQFDDQIDAAEAKLAENPKDEKALLDLAEVHYQAAQFNLQQDPESSDAQAQFADSLDAWERYLKLDPKKPDPGVAAFAAQAYVQVGDAEGAAEAQRIVAEDNPSVGTYANLAYYLYAAGKIDEGNAAADQAVAKAEGSEKQQVSKQLDQIAEQAQKLLAEAHKQAQQAQEAAQQQGGGGAAPPGAAPIQDPFGSLGGAGGLGTAPGTTAPPAP